ncbi:MAG TPA: CAP domain-containing protein [Candidatus Paceibacterota bacterium]|nr:CAP domain-containing protein [Candidatus Paceibacterota bacterium]
MKTLRHHSIRWFIAHELNGFRPKILEWKYFILALVIIVGVKGLSVATYTRSLGADIFNQITQSDLYTLTNQTRAEQNVPALAISPVLEQVAEMKLQDMIAHDYFAHVSPDGVTPWAWFDKARYRYAVAGENLAMDFASSDQVMQAWLNSETHRKNILMPDFTEIGIATGAAMIDGQTRTIVVQEFARPAVPAIPAAAQPETAVEISAPASQSAPARPGVVQGTADAASPAQMPYTSWSMIQILLVAVSCASGLLLIIHVGQKIHEHSPALLARSAAIAGMAIAVASIGDWHFIFNHTFLP